MGERSDRNHIEGSARAWLGLAVLALPTLLVAMDITVLHLAVPAMTTALAPTSTEMLWIVDIYGFMIAGLLVTMGTLGDRLGRRRLLMIGAVGFSSASLLAAFASSPQMLILARALLGITAATLMPSTLSLITNMFRDEAERGLAIAIWSSTFMAGAAAGPLLGGILLEYFWWGSVFLLNVPVTLLLVVAAPFLLPEYRAPRRGRIDLLGIVSSLVGILSLIYGIKQAATGGAPGSWAAMAFGALMLALFVRRQLRMAEPMLDLSLFRNPVFSAALAIQAFAIFAIGTPYFLGAQYLQLVLGSSPLEAGIAMLPMTVAGILAAIGASRLTSLVRPAHIIAIALGIGAAGLGILTGIGGETGPTALVLVAGLSLAEAGIAAATALTVDLVVGAAPPERAGEASGLSETSGELGMALSIAMTGSLSIAVYRSELGGELPDDLPAGLTEAAMESLGRLSAALAQTAHPAAADLTAAANAAFSSGMFAAALVGLCLMTLLAGVAIAFLRRAGSTPEIEAE